jgi:hypothetical protein
MASSVTSAHSPRDALASPPPHAGSTPHSPASTFAQPLFSSSPTINPLADLIDEHAETPRLPSPAGLLHRQSVQPSGSRSGPRVAALVSAQLDALMGPLDMCEATEAAQTEQAEHDITGLVRAAPTARRAPRAACLVAFVLLALATHTYLHA